MCGTEWTPKPRPARPRAWAGFLARGQRAARPAHQLGNLNSNENTTSADVKYAEAGENCDFRPKTPFFSETIWRRSILRITNRKSYSIRSIRVGPDDVQWYYKAGRDGSIFQLYLRTYAWTVRRRTTACGGASCFTIVSATPYKRRGGAPASPKNRPIPVMWSETTVLRTIPIWERINRSWSWSCRSDVLWNTILSRSSS